MESAPRDMDQLQQQQQRECMPDLQQTFDIKPLEGSTLPLTPKPLEAVPVSQNYIFQYGQEEPRQASVSPPYPHHDSTEDELGRDMMEHLAEEEDPGHHGILDSKGKPKFMGKCKVCGDDASGMYFGALVCVPCKTFFLRYYGDNFSFVCRNQKNCEINVKSRTQCKYCRMQKCLQVGMLRRVRPSQVQISEGQQLCVVCSDLANGLHFGAITCEGCKKFFRRGLKEHPTYVCKNDKDCVINPRTRNACRYCRYQKCLQAGMCREAIQMGRPSKFRGHTNVFDINMPFSKPRHETDTRSEPHAVAPSASTVTPHNGGNLPYHLPRVGGGNNPPSSSSSGGQPMDQNALLSVVGHVVKNIGGNNNNRSNSSSGSGGNPNQTTSLSIPRPNIPFEVKSEPPDYDYHPSPGEPYGRYPQTSPTPGGGGGQMLDLPDSILQLSTPWDMVKTMNQQMNCAVSSFLTSDQTELVNQITHTTKYSTAGGALVTQTSAVLTTMPSVCEARPSGGGNTTLSSSLSSTQALLYGSQSVPSPEELDIMANLQKALGVLDEPNFPLREEEVGDAGGMNQPVISQPNPTTMSSSNYQQESPPQYRSITSNTTSNTSTSTPSPPNNNPKKVPLEEILQPELLMEQHIPCGVQQDSLAKFNEFMSKSHQQLSQWIHYLRKESNKAISPNNTTLRVIMQTNNQDFDPTYWTNPTLPAENILFSDEHRKILEQITEAYSVFVEDGHRINIQLTKEFQEWLHKAGYNNAEEITDSDFPDFFNKRVVELYTVCSVAYCKKLPGFTKFDPTDQYNIVRLGQSQSRILAAACHWYNKAARDFDYFLSWKPKNALREHKFKDSCVKYAEMIAHRDWDAVESALTNVLTMIATDYPELKQPSIIQQTRMSILRSFRAYTTAKYGMPNSRIEEQFSYIPKLRELGLLHYKWTMVTVLEQESSGEGQGIQEDVLL